MRMVHLGAYILFRGFWALVGVLPPAWARSFLESVAVLAARVDRRHRSIVQSNLRIAFPEWPQDRLARATEQAFRNWGRVVAELVHARALGARQEDGWLAPLESAVEDAAAAGRGVLVLTAHTANFELLGRLWGLHGGRPIAIFNRAQSNPFVDDFLRRERLAASVSTVDRGTALVRQALRRLAAGDVVVAPLDQNQPPGRGVFVEMFGKPACTSTLMARLSLTSGAPVLPVFAVWHDDRLSVEVGAPILPPQSALPLRGLERQRAVRDMTAAYTQEIESVVARYPEQWNWAHRRWKTRPRPEAESPLPDLALAAGGGVVERPPR